MLGYSPSRSTSHPFSHYLSLPLLSPPSFSLHLPSLLVHQALPISSSLPCSRHPASVSFPLISLPRRVSFHPKSSCHNRLLLLLLLLLLPHLLQNMKLIYRAVSRVLANNGLLSSCSPLAATMSCFLSLTPPPNISLFLSVVLLAWPPSFFPSVSLLPLWEYSFSHSSSFVSLWDLCEVSWVIKVCVMVD